MKLEAIVKVTTILFLLWSGKIILVREKSYFGQGKVREFES